MNQEKYALKWSRSEWRTLCKYDEFVGAFWEKNFDKCDEIAANLRYMGVFGKASK